VPRLAAAAALAVVAAAFALMLADAVESGDWPGWDEGWATIAFPLGIPLAVAGALAVASARERLRLTLAVTLAVWAWGGIVFALWLALG
jgi:hypothetical protein